MKCDELTPIELECNMGKDINGVVHREPWKAYDIDEVDALLAKKDKEIAELKEQIEVLKHQACKMDCMTVKLYNEACDDIIHQKYKRCLSVADKCAETAKKYYYLICLDGSNNPKYDRFPNKMDFWGRWRKRWLELAEKFKEAK